jgi:hypothetical protein
MLYWDVDLSETNVLFWWQKRTRKPPAIERLGGGEAMKAPLGLSCRQSGLRSKCRVFSAARTGIHEKGATRPFQTPKEKSKRKKASRFAKTGCGSQRLLRCRSHPAGRCPNSSSLFPPLAAVVAVALFSRFSGLRLAENSKPSAFLSERDIIYFYNSEVIS